MTSQVLYYQSSKYFGTGKKALERMQKIEFLRIYEEAVLVKRFILGWSFLAALEGQRGPEYYGNAGYGVFFYLFELKEIWRKGVGDECCLLKPCPSSH